MSKVKTAVKQIKRFKTIPIPHLTDVIPRKIFHLNGQLVFMYAHSICFPPPPFFSWRGLTVTVCRWRGQHWSREGACHLTVEPWRWSQWPEPPAGSESLCSCSWRCRLSVQKGTVSLESKETRLIQDCQNINIFWKYLITFLETSKIFKSIYILHIIL